MVTTAANPARTLPAFRNEPYLDFSKPENRKSAAEALALVRSRFDATYPLRVAGREARTGDLLKSVNPSQPSEVVGYHEKATAALAREAVESAYAFFPEWSATPAADRVSMLFHAGEILRRRKLEFDAWLVLDDAHGFGVLGDGRGSLADAGIASERIVYMGTLGKAAGVAGAFVCAHPVVIDTIVQTARPYIYTTAAPAALACALLESVAIIRDDASRRARLADRIAQFRVAAQGLRWPLMPSRTAIQPIVIGESSDAMAAAGRLWDDGIWVPAIRPPTVPLHAARLRVSLSAAHDAEDVERLVAALRR